MAAKFFTGLPLDGPDPECVKGHGERALPPSTRRSAPEAVARPLAPHRVRSRSPLTARPDGAPVQRRPPASACDENPLAGLPSRRPTGGDVPAAHRRPDLADLTSPEVGERAAAGAVLAVPLGSTEQHGPHLPLSTDTDIAVALCAPAGRRPAGRARRAAAALRVQRRARRLRRHAVDRAGGAGAAASSSSAARRPRRSRGSCSCRRTAATPSRCARAVARLRAESRDVRLFEPRWAGDAHAGRAETSMQLALRPGASAPSRRVPGDTRPLARAAAAAARPAASGR